MFVSSACVKHRHIKDSVIELAAQGYKDIELSGGTSYYSEYKEDLLRLKPELGLNYLVHNYFPPPQEDFILNLASLNDAVFRKSMDHVAGAIGLSQALGGDKLGVHAGFFIDISVNEIGKKISRSDLYDRHKCMDRFCGAFEALKKKAQGVELYLENNVFSSTNSNTFNGENFFMLTTAEEYAQLKERIDFKLLLDVGHLYVSTKTLGIDFEEQLRALLPVSDYVHLSDNDALHDQNRCFFPDSALLNVLKKYNLKGKTVTVETYGSLSELKQSYGCVQSALGLS